MSRRIAGRPVPLACGLLALALVPFAAGAADNAVSTGGKLRIAPAAPAPGQTIEAAEAALADAWARGPFVARKALFVSAKAPMVGDYEARASNVFALGEPLLSYFEPVGYQWRQDGEFYRFGITIDLELRTKSGRIIGGQKAFQKTEFRSRNRLRELNLNMTLTLDDIDPGEYVVAYTLNDDVSGRSTQVEQPFVIKADGPKPDGEPAK